MKGEAKLQSECLKWFKLQYPQYSKLLFAIPNGGSRHKAEAANLKRQGVVAGVPDLFLATSKNEITQKADRYSVYKTYHGLFIEMKHGKNGLTRPQELMLTELEDQGYQTAVCRTFDEFKEAIENYL